MTHRPLGIALAAAGAALVIAGCSSAAPDVPAASSSSAPATASSRAVAADPAMEHIHNLALRGDTLLLGSHHGLWEQQPGQTATQVSEAFDVMGFALDGETYLASGHPGEGMSAPADLGLLKSTDAGRSWQTVSLSGEVDFHRLVASGKTILGVDSGDGSLRRSTDGGATWTNLGPGPFDIALDPTDPDYVLGTTKEGPVVSTDGGRTFEPVNGAPVIAFLSWQGDTLGGIAPDGTVYTSANRGRTWRHAGHVSAQPAAFTMAGKHVAVLAGDTILESRDGGRTFAPRITGLTA
jgi:photosystem II stability/assembly factor-like uncharacterized protein